MTDTETKHIKHSSELKIGKQEQNESKLRVTTPDPDRYSLCDKTTYTPTTNPADAEIGRGGIGRVLIALDQHLGRKVAIKELLPARVGESLDEVFMSPAPLDSDDMYEDQPAGTQEKARNTVERFLREARVTGQLGHPSIVPVYELGRKADGTLYYTMKVVRGRTLAQALDECKKLKQRLSLLTHFIDLCQAVAYAHSRGVVHRDIKPANVMVGEFGETVVLDWGLSKVRGVKDLGSRELRKDIELLKGCEAAQTLDGTAIGTPAYMSPEQASGDIKSIDERSDIWSLGAVLYRILTGRAPFSGDTAFEVIAKVQRQDVAPVQSLCLDAPAELASICTKALNRDRDRRYQGAKSLADDVKAFMTGGKVGAYQYNFGDLLSKWISKHRIPVSTALVSLVLLVALGVTSYFRVVRDRDIAQQLKQEADTARQQAKLRMAEAFWEGSRSAMLQGDMLEARAKLRSSMEVTDSVTGRMLWSKSMNIPLVWKKRFSTPLHSLALSPSGKEIAVGGLDGSIYVLDEKTADTKVLRGHKSWVASLCYSQDGKRIFSAGADKVIRIWDAVSSKAVASLTGHTATIHDIAVRPQGDILLSASQDKTIRLWDISTGRQIQKIESFGSIPWSIVFSPDGKTLFAGCRDGSIHVWELSGKVLSETAQMRQPTGGVSALAISANGKALASGSNDSRIYIWNLPDKPSSRTVPKVLAGHEDGIAELTFSPDGRQLASGSYDSTVRIWPLDTGDKRPVSVIKQHKDWIAGVEFLPDGGFLVSASEDNTVALWKLPIGQKLKGKQTKVHEGALTTVAIDPTGSIIATGGEDRTIRLWDAATGKFRQTIHGHTEPIYGLRFGPNGCLVSADWTKRIYTWVKGVDGYEKKSAIQLAGDGDLNTNVAIDSSGRYIAAADYDRTIRLWDLKTGSERVLKGHTDLVRSVAFSKDGRLLASASWDRTIRTWSPRTGKCTMVLRGHLSEVNDVIFGRDNQTLYSVGWDLTLRRWNIAKRQKTTIGITKQRYEVIAIRPDGKMLAGGMADGEIELWDLETFHSKVFKAHDGTIYDLTFSPDQATLISAAEDGTVRAFDSRTTQPRWKAPLIITPHGTAPLAYTHEGWIVPGRGKVKPKIRSKAWISAAKNSLYTVVRKNTACLQTAQGLSMWDTNVDSHLLDAHIGHVQGIVAFDGGCVVRADGICTLYYADKEARTEFSNTTAITMDQDKLLIADDQYMHIVETSGLERRKVPISEGACAGARLKHDHRWWLMTGYTDGTIEIYTMDGKPVKLSLQQLPSSPVTLITPGPMSTAIIGFSNGLLGLWELGSGVRLDAVRLHGRPRHIALLDGHVYAVSDLGDHLRWNLSIFEDKYCQLLKSIWGQVPVVWQDGKAVSRPPDARHPCMSQQSSW